MKITDALARHLDPSKHQEIFARALAGQAPKIIAKGMELPLDVVMRCIAVPPPFIKSDKKWPEFDHREWTDHAIKTQELYARASTSQKFGDISLGDGKHSACILPWSDLHWGSRGTNYRIFRKTTEEILKTPHLYIALVGDLVEFAVKLRSVAEVCAQIFGPDKQVQWLENWLDEIKPKLILATWCNHAVEREEKQVGVSTIKRLLAERTVMFDGIGHADIRVGQQVYKFAFSHKFRGYSYLNAGHAGARYMRFQGIDREIAVMGDIHQPAYNHYYDGPMERLSLVAGTLNTDSTYAARYFSIFTQPEYPVIELSHREHTFVPFKNLRTWLQHRGK